MAAAQTDDDEQLARALAASLALDQQQQRHHQHTHVARTDEEEDLALSLAVAASLAEQEGREHAAGAAPHPAHPPPAYPHQQPAQHRPAPAAQHRPPPAAQHRPPQGASQPGSSSSSSSTGGGREWRWPGNALRLLDSAVQKVAGELGGSTCAGCGRALGFGGTLNALGKQWHPECFKCAGCAQPVGLSPNVATTFAVGEDGQPYHAQCHKQLHHPRCYVCGDFIPTRGDGRIEWREQTFWRQPHCPAHSVDGTPACCSCTLLKPVSEEWVTLQDGRQLCLACLDTLVVDTKDAQPLYDEVLQFFRYQGMPHAYKVPLLLVEGPVLEEYADREGRPREPGASGPVFHVRGLCVAHVYTTIPSVVALGGSHAAAAVRSVATALARPQQQQRCTVSTLLVMYGLPRLLAGSIIAHELMHAYLRMRHVAGLPLQIEEGVCQLMAQLWLDSQDHWARACGNPYQQRLLSYFSHQVRTDTSEVYGDGFRIALEKFQQRGLRALVEHVIAHRDWPAWAA